jgi:hypothetical protein
VIYTDYVFAFELAAIVLLVAIVAAIAITLRTRKETKYQHPSEQLAVRAADRLKIVKMSPRAGTVIPLNHFLVLGALLFAIGVGRHLHEPQEPDRAC